MGILPLKKRINRDKCIFATKLRMFGVFAINEILRYRGTQFPGSRTLCHPGLTNTLEAHFLDEQAVSCNTCSHTSCICIYIYNVFAIWHTQHSGGYTFVSATLQVARLALPVQIYFSFETKLKREAHSHQEPKKSTKYRLLGAYI